MIPLSALDPAGLRELCALVGAPAWRAAQIEEAIWRPDVGSVDDIRQLPAHLRRAVGERASFSSVDVLAQTVTDAGHTLKLLCRLGDGTTVEAGALETPARSDPRRP